MSHLHNVFLRKTDPKLRLNSSVHESPSWNKQTNGFPERERTIVIKET